MTLDAIGRVASAAVMGDMPVGDVARWLGVSTCTVRWSMALYRLRKARRLAPTRWCKDGRRLGAREGPRHEVSGTRENHA